MSLDGGEKDLQEAGEDGQMPREKFPGEPRPL